MIAIITYDEITYGSVKERNIMQTVEFESKSYNGIIEIPVIHKEWYDRPVKVILLTDNKLKNSRKDSDRRN